MINIKRVNICNIPLDVLTMKQTVEIISNAIDKKESVQHCAINAAKLVFAQKNHELRRSIVACDIINADGKSIVWASRILNKPLPERVTGIDLMQNLVELAARKSFKIFFFGANENVVKKVVEIYAAQYGAGIIAGYRNGYYSKDDEPAIAKQICDSRADILVVAISSPKKEIFLNAYSSMLQVPFTMGVGGSFDVVAGIVKRAPLWMQSAGLEWLFRVIQEPSRMWKRYLTTNTAFIYLVIKEKLFSSPKIDMNSTIITK